MSWIVEFQIIYKQAFRITGYWFKTNFKILNKTVKKELDVTRFYYGSKKQSLTFSL